MNSEQGDSPLDVLAMLSNKASSDEALDQSIFESDDSDHGIECEELPQISVGKRRCGLSAEAHGGWNQRRAQFSPTMEEKHPDERDAITRGLIRCPFFCSAEASTLGRIADTMIMETFKPGDIIVQQGDVGRSGYLLMDGIVDVYDDTEIMAAQQSGGSSGSAPVKGTWGGEMTMLWGLRRTMSVYASTDCVLAKLKRDSYMKLVTQEEMMARTNREDILRKVEMFETLSDEHISQIADALEKKSFEPDEAIIKQGEPGKEFYVMLSGECKATVATGTDSQKIDVQEYRRYHAGDVFGERALLLKTTRAATITAVSHVEVLCLKRSRFERMLGPLEMLNKEHYLSDPRKSIADFYRVGDQNGPLGSLSGPRDPAHESAWFAVYRPTSRDAIAKLLSGKAVGKGLNVKGKSAKKNRMSGFVPYLQISKEEHKSCLEESDMSASVVVYFTTKGAFDLVYTTFSEQGFANMLKPNYRYDPQAYGLEMPEHILRKAYILEQNITFLSGWETGRQSEPAFMDMNLHAVVGNSEPEVVLIQMDSENPMNPHALLIAYAEGSVKPVVSDFDTFTVGCRGMKYDKLPPEQQKLAVWALDNTEGILRNQSKASWNSRWLEVLKEANENGFKPNVPKYGFGDATSYRLIEAVIQATQDSGAVRHGAECFNFGFPQELDEDYLVVWEEFDDKPWAYMDEDDLRSFLLERSDEGYSFPLNPVWPVRDVGWYEVYEALWDNENARETMESWYPEESGIRERIEALHQQYPDGFLTMLSEPSATVSGSGSGQASNRISVIEDLDAAERVDLVLNQVN
eukprot:CAMPEP_0171160960 /NCGR_PEP_ID=MMETSP0790-20130122/3825_1 /TAXON_ID=2925 /ORGANISM="Alexandrium catenella, Strain OF101" /LENGTH=802 /DNA_ID=CAMNT_0011625507 /DNA_START=112 /DNA_END=2521 /DNA_ORIENTATION=+